MSDSENEPRPEALWLEATAQWRSMTVLQRFDDDDDDDDDAIPYEPLQSLTEFDDTWLEIDEPWLAPRRPPLWQNVADLVEFIEGVLEKLNIRDGDREAQNYAFYEHFSIDQADDGAWYARWKGHDERITFDSNDEEKLKNILLEYILLRCPINSPYWTHIPTCGY